MTAIPAVDVLFGVVDPVARVWSLRAAWEGRSRRPSRWRMHPSAWYVVRSKLDGSLFVGYDDGRPRLFGLPVVEDGMLPDLFVMIEEDPA